MDEDVLKEAIEQYKQQIIQIQTVLESGQIEGRAELAKLKDDLTELIQVTEESLLSLKKSQLLQLLEQQESSHHDSGTPETDTKTSVDYRNSYVNDHTIDDNDDEDNDENIIGTKCRVAFTQEWGVKEHHNAMVFKLESIPLDEETVDQAKVRVLFLNPTHRSMVPCPYFLEGKCKFAGAECRFSHGYLVDVEHLKPFKEPDFSSVKAGQRCLARYSDGVWYNSTIKSIKHESHEFLIHYETYNTDATLPLDDIYPLGPEEVESDSESDSQSDTGDSSSSKAAIEQDDDVIRYAWKPTGALSSLGDWEQHTKGIGSKLMAKMGYIFGKGLGKDGEGRVEPIEVVVLPQGKSLDKCAELREKNKLKEPFKRKKKKLVVASTTSASQGKASDVFDFINHKLGHSKGSLHDLRVSHPGAKPDIRKTRKSADENTNWNIQLFKIHEEISSVKKQLNKQEEALQRHTTRDSRNKTIFTEKRDSVHNRLQELLKKEKKIQEKIHQKDQHRKLTVF
ncbi:predicted protein [Nematostella vectensis]|uniref:Zinc finger CCCH-type with G patch domain-containing protein n=1 Tax=Nematostella vectensis TaxID=45351 RepID=ZGPAT_NEMVE|nr:zinc finger CCCH-type with G patch domain-containing protein [Nematostella vectensis]A7SBN6.1 RecName: Full=Zinc finger CCCH-type with G patch domain-containing protein [Nematostella vectensis]EDO38903.1 predicted protein [Nematostella vectensis]|eukprot:XP_001630966.1 predicted protein [Nematostella vectensis]